MIWPFCYTGFAHPSTHSWIELAGISVFKWTQYWFIFLVWQGKRCVGYVAATRFRANPSLLSRTNAGWKGTNVREHMLSYLEEASVTDFYCRTQQAPLWPGFIWAGKLDSTGPLVCPWMYPESVLHLHLSLLGQVNSTSLGSVSCCLRNCS